MEKQQKNIRKTVTGLHVVGLLLIIGIIAVFVTDGDRMWARSLLVLIFLCLVIEGCFLVQYFRISGEMESDLTRSQVELLEQQLRSNEDKLNALQSQINPHFLYNTLETIRGMALEKGEKDLGKIISSLSLMFRYSMDFSNTIVPIEHELAQVERYIKIQQLRFPGRFELRLVKNCDEEDLRQIMIPKFSIQPLVENAYGHAFKHMSEGCILTIRLSDLKDRFEIAVEDNGEGMDEETTKELNKTILYGKAIHEEGSSHNGIGLHNIYSRLHLYFGEDVSMYVYSAKEVGTTITMNLPLQRNA